MSTKTVVIMATICFLGSVIMQAWWIRSAYQGELAFYNKEKSQFQSSVQDKIKQNPQLKQQLKLLLDKNKETGSISVEDQRILVNKIGKVIQDVLHDKPYGIYLKNYGIARHNHAGKGEPNHFTPVAFLNADKLDTKTFESSGKLCLYCLVQDEKEAHGDTNYELSFIYEKEELGIYKKMGFLIAGSMLFLLFLGLLFRHVLKKYKDEKRLSESKNDFINNLSHELQTPVFAVQVANKLIKEKTINEEELQPYVAVIEKETKQLKLHAGKILELASLENDKMPLNLETVEINSLIEEKRATLEMMLEDKGGKFMFSKHNGELFAELDRTHFNTVVISLIENAIKYNDTVPEVTIETGEKNEMISVHVKDNGIGIHGKYLPYVFDKFYRVPNAGRDKLKGFGLGLSYVKQIVAMHHGTVEIKSEPGAGTLVTVLLSKTKADV